MTVFSWTPNAAMSNVDGCREDLIELLHVWKRQSSLLSERISEGLTQGNASSVFLAAHTMKGSIQILSLDQDCQALTRIEAAAKREDLAEVEAMLPMWNDQLALINQAINQ